MAVKKGKSFHIVIIGISSGTILKESFCHIYQRFSIKLIIVIAMNTSTTLVLKYSEC